MQMSAHRHVFMNSPCARCACPRLGYCPRHATQGYLAPMSRPMRRRPRTDSALRDAVAMSDAMGIVVGGMSRAPAAAGDQLPRCRRMRELGLNLSSGERGRGCIFESATCSRPSSQARTSGSTSCPPHSRKPGLVAAGVARRERHARRVQTRRAAAALSVEIRHRLALTRWPQRHGTTPHCVAQARTRRPMIDAIVPSAAVVAGPEACIDVDEERWRRSPVAI